jgi:hypothetical protein
MKRKNNKETVRWRRRFKGEGRREVVDGGENNLGLKGLQKKFKIRVMNRQIIST